MKQTGSVYDPETDGGSFKLYTGKVPAHIVKFEESKHITNKWDVTEGSKVKFIRTGDDELAAGEVAEVEKVFLNFTFKVHEKASKALIKEDGSEVEVAGDVLKGREIRGSVPYILNPHKRIRWMNNEYISFVEDALGIEFPLTEVQTPDGIKKVKDIQLVEEEDVLGIPVIIELGVREYKDRETGDTKKTQDVKNILHWESGERISMDELVGNDSEYDDLQNEVPF